jgi:hypothetical protein
MWTDAKNDRRCELVDQKIAGALTPTEAAELAELQEQMALHRDQVAPLPVEYARELYRDLRDRDKAGNKPEQS